MKKIRMTMTVSDAGINQHGNSFSRQFGKSYELPIEEARKLFAAGHAIPSKGASFNPLADPQIKQTFTPRNFRDGDKVKAAQAKLGTIDRKIAKADAALEKARGALTAYQQVDRLAADADAMLADREIVDETPQLESAVRLRERELRALKELRSRAEAELADATATEKAAIVAEATPEIRKREKALIAALEQVRSEFETCRELHRRYEAAGAPLPTSVLSVPSFAADLSPTGMLDQALLDLIEAPQQPIEDKLGNWAPPKPAHFREAVPQSTPPLPTYGGMLGTSY